MDSKYTKRAARSGSHVPSTSIRRVLVVCGHDKDSPESVLFERGVQAVLRSATEEQVDCVTEYLGSNGVAGDVRTAAARDRIQAKYAHQHIDVAIAQSSEALEFALSCRRDRFHDLPIVFHAFGAPAPVSSGEANNLTGIVADDVFGKTLRAALDLHPATHEVFFVAAGGLDRNGPLDDRLREALRARDGRRGSATLTYLPDRPLASVIERIRSAGNTSLVLYGNDSGEEPSRGPEPIDVPGLIAAAAHVPVYGVSQSMVGNGAVGGYSIDVEQAGVEAGRMALQILNGVAASDIPLVTIASTPRFDWRQLRRWNIPETLLPPGSVVRFRDPSLLQQSKRYVVTGLQVVTAQAALMAGLVIQSVRRRRAEERSRSSEERFRSIEARNSAILRAVPDLIFVLLRDGTYVDFHARYPELLYAPPGEFIGRTIREVMRPPLAEMFMAAIEQACLADEPVVVEYELPRPERRHFEARIVYAGQDRVLAVVRDITESKRAEERNRDLAGRLIASQELERQRIARDLHDDLGQKIALLNIEIDQIAGRLEPGDERMRLEQLSHRASEIASDVHNLSYELHPSKLQTLGLVAAVQALCRDTSLQPGFEVAFSHGTMPPSVDPSVSLCLYRITQEALRNAARHSHARKASVQLTRDRDDLCLDVADRGVGFDPRELRHAGLGLVSMRERVSSLNGELAIQAAPGAGTRIGVRIPFKPTAQNVPRIPRSA